jgi:TolB protein
MTEFMTTFAPTSLLLRQFCPAALPLRRSGIVLLSGLLAIVAVWPASAQLTGRQLEGSLSPIPIAIPEFVGDNPQLATEISNVVANDLESSGLFKPLDRASFLEAVRDINAPPRMVDWRSIGADALTVGRVTRDASGRLSSEFRLWDVATGKQLAGQRFATAEANWRRVGHIIATSD